MQKGWPKERSKKSTKMKPTRSSSKR